MFRRRFSIMHVGTLVLFGNLLVQRAMRKSAGRDHEVAWPKVATARCARAESRRWVVAQSRFFEAIPAKGHKDGPSNGEKRTDSGS